MKKLRGLKFIRLCVMVILVALPGCDSQDPVEGGAKLNEMNEILQFVAIHQSKTEVETDSHSGGSNFSITKKHKSDAPFAEIKEFYYQQLVNQGWHFVEEQELKDRGRFRDERVLNFTCGEFLLTVQFSARRGVDVGWDYALRIAYPSDWTEGKSQTSRNGNFTLPPDGIALKEVELLLARQAVERTGGKLTKAAKLLHVSRDQIRYRLNKSAE